LVKSPSFAEKSDGWFTGGWFVASPAMRVIDSHAGQTVTLSDEIRGLLAGTPFTAYAGCDGRPGTCEKRFGNKANYGGDEKLPTENLFVTGVGQHVAELAIDHEGLIPPCTPGQQEQFDTGA
jgi:hypothetical protein